MDWPGLKVLAWLQIWPQKNAYFFFLPTLKLRLSLFIQLFIDLNKYSTKHYLSTHESEYKGAVNTLSWN